MPSRCMISARMSGRCWTRSANERTRSPSSSFLPSRSTFGSRLGAEDLYLVTFILPSTDWAGTLVGARVELGPKKIAELIERYRAARDDGRAKAAALDHGAGDYVPWPKSLSAYLLGELRREHELRYFVLDHTQFDAKFQAKEGYQPL